MSHKYHINNRFASCRLLAKTYDMHRSRHVSVFMLPGEFSVVGVTDGVDAWVAPTVINPFSCNVQDILRRIQAGENVPVVVRGIPEDAPEAPKARRRLTSEAPATSALPRRRLLAVEPQTQQPQTRRRLNNACA